MASSQEYIDFVCSQIQGAGIIRAKKMFGEYMIYCDEKAVILVCDNICYVKKDSAIAPLMISAECGFPYPGAKEHYILDIDHRDTAKQIVRILADVLPYPKKRSNNKKTQK